MSVQNDNSNNLLPSWLYLYTAVDITTHVLNQNADKKVWSEGPLDQNLGSTSQVNADILSYWNKNNLNINITMNIKGR